MTEHSHCDVLDRLNAMRAQSETMPRCTNYFMQHCTADGISESSRISMVSWIKQVQSTLGLNRETVWIGMSYFDRYLSSGRGRSSEVLKSRCKFQLAAIACFYTAVKIHEPVVLGLDMLVQICQGAYVESDFTEMERDILEALGWRVAVHTPIEFARHLLELLSEEMTPRAADALLEDCQRRVDRTVGDLYFSTFAAADLGIYCLASAMGESEVLSLSETQSLWFRLAELCDFDLYSKEIDVLMSSLQSSVSSHKRRSESKLSQPSRYGVLAPSSPVCVTKAARQA